MKLVIKIIIFIISFSFIFCTIYLYAKFFGAKGFIVNEYKIETNKISEAYDGFKIAHLSDIHYGLGMTKSDLQKIVDDVNLLKPDIIVFTGDLVNNYVSEEEYAELVEVLNQLKATSGKYIIEGNHDNKYNKWANLVDDCGLTNLNDTYENIYSNSTDSIFIAGVSNNTYTTKKIEDKTEFIFDYLNSSEYNETFNILLLHEPDFVKDIDFEMFDLILGGHSHNGQVRLPFIGAFHTPKYAKKYYKPYYDLETADFYISNGLGTSELPVRLFNRPSYNFYRLIKKQDK